MRSHTALLVALVLWAGPASAAAVTVNFVDPEHYTDIGRYGGIDRKRNLDAIQKIFADLAARYLAADSVLSIDVLDVDLAGRLEPWHNKGDDVRYMRDITWPRMTLRYTRDGGTASEETLADPGYLDFPNPHFSNEPLSYEKAMIERWFRKTFAQKPR